MSEAKTEKLIAELNAMPEVDNAQYDSQWIKRLLHLLEIINRIVIILSTMLAVAVLLIVGNTIRLVDLQSSIRDRDYQALRRYRQFHPTTLFIQRSLVWRLRRHHCLVVDYDFHVFIKWTGKTTLQPVFQ